jgi:TonB family protein
MKRLWLLSGLVLTGLALNAVCEGQESKQVLVPASVAASHLIKSVQPVYPPMAAMGHIQGRVTLEVTIAPDGSVTESRALSGHPLLIPPALAAAKNWKYSPFLLNGAAVPVQATVYVLFAMGPEAGLEQKYFAQEIQCHDTLDAKHFQEAAASCNAALRTAKDIRGNTALKITAYGEAGQAAYHLNNFPEALQDFQERLKQAKKDLSADSSEWFEVHHDLASTLRASGQMDQADNEYKESEKALSVEEKSLKREQNSKTTYVLHRQEEVRKQLRQTLTEHAGLLREMGHNAEADNLEQKAKSLDPEDANDTKP